MNIPGGHGLLLKKALYGTKQAARWWWLYLKNVPDKLGFGASQYDNSLYFLKHSSKAGVIWIHVDDRVVTTSHESLLLDLEKSLKGILQIKWAGIRFYYRCQHYEDPQIYSESNFFDKTNPTRALGQ